MNQRTQGNLANLIYGIRIMGIVPSRGWVRSFVARVDAVLAAAGVEADGGVDGDAGVNGGAGVQADVGVDGNASVDDDDDAGVKRGAGSPSTRAEGQAHIASAMVGRAASQALALDQPRKQACEDGQSVALPAEDGQGVALPVEDMPPPRLRVNQISFGKIVWGVEHLDANAHARWARHDWIGSALEMYS